MECQKHPKSGGEELQLHEHRENKSDTKILTTSKKCDTLFTEVKNETKSCFHWSCFLYLASLTAKINIVYKRHFTYRVEKNNNA